MNRRQFMISSGVLLGTSMSTLFTEVMAQKSLPKTPKMPVLFIGHGSPMNAIRNNRYHQSWNKLGQQLPAPSAILVVSAHWLSYGTTQVMATPEPETIHDFRGFPKALFDKQYPAKGSLETAVITKELLQGKSQSGFQLISELEHNRGLDHGTWSVLTAMFPEAQIPVLQLSIDYEKPAAYHYDIGRQLAALRERGVLIIGSGNIVHNLRAPRMANKKPYDWGLELDNQLAEAMTDHNDKPLIDAPTKQVKIMELAHPTLEHYLPLLYALGAKNKQDKVTLFNSDFASSAISMRSVMYSA